MTVSAANPTLGTIPNPTAVSLGLNAVTLKDTADLESGYSPTGTITFTLFDNGGATPVDTETVTVTGNGTYTTPRLHAAQQRHGDRHLPVGRHLQRRCQQQRRQRHCIPTSR